MLEFVTMLNAYEEAAATGAKLKQQQVEQLFRAIDADASGCIDEGEFVRELERARYREMWGDVGRCRAIWGDIGRVRP